VIGDEVSFASVGVALAAGAIGAILTGLAAFAARLSRIGQEIQFNDRQLRNLDRMLETFATDRTMSLSRDLAGVRADLTARNLFYSGAYGQRLAEAKEHSSPHCLQPLRPD
jgi:hypothetical protein